jgi:hypothetical protein
MKIPYKYEEVMIEDVGEGTNEKIVVVWVKHDGNRWHPVMTTDGNIFNYWTIELAKAIIDAPMFSQWRELTPLVKPSEQYYTD